MPRHILSPKNCSFAWMIWTPFSTCFLQPIPVHYPNGISIGSVVFAQLTAECRYRYRGMPFTLKIAPSHGDLNPHLTHGSLDPPDSASQMASRSGQPFMHSSQDTVHILTMGTLPPPKLLLSMGVHDPHLIHCSLGPPESTAQMASQSVQRFFAGFRRRVPMLYSGLPVSSQNCQFRWGSGPPSNTWFIRHTCNPKQHLNRFSCFCMNHDYNRQT